MAAAPFQWTHDATPPTVSLSETSLTSRHMIFRVEFSEDVTYFFKHMLLAVGCTITSMQVRALPRVGSFPFPILVDSSLSLCVITSMQTLLERRLYECTALFDDIFAAVSLPANTVFDLAGNPNVGSRVLDRTYTGYGVLDGGMRVRAPPRLAMHGSRLSLYE
jgi:hypothetical protein